MALKDKEIQNLEPSAILVVAPYNVQVDALIAASPPGVPVGTADRFQGQEMPVRVAV